MQMGVQNAIAPEVLDSVKVMKKLDKTTQNGHFTVHIVSTGTWCFALFLVLILVLSVPQKSGVPRVAETGTKLQLKKIR